MKIINPSTTLIDRPENQLKLVEEIGRTCYKSNDLITEDSYKTFCSGLFRRKHLAMLEHAVFHFCIDKTDLYKIFYVNEEITRLSTKGYKHFIIDEMANHNLLITANLRSILEINNIHLTVSLLRHYQYLQCLEIKGRDYAINKILGADNFIWIDDNILKDYFQSGMITNKTYLRHCCMTVKFICNRAISHELVRHRPCSFAQVSQRYVNYSKKKFGNEISFIKPLFYNQDTPENQDNYTVWLNCCKRIEWTYFHLLEAGHKPEEARGVLSNDVATEIYVTASGEEWQHIINLRAFDTTGKAHPQMKEIMIPLAEELINRNIGISKPTKE